MPGAERGQQSPQPACLTGVGIAVDEPPHFNHGASRIVEPLLIELREGQAEAHIFGGSELAGVPLQRFELRHRGERLTEGTREELGATEQGGEAIARRLGALAVRFGRGIGVPACRECLLRREAASGAGQPDVDEHSVYELDERVEDRLHHAGHESEEGPEESGKQERARLHAGQRQHEGDDCAAAHEKGNHASQVPERIGVEGFGAATQAFRKERHAPKVEAGQWRGKLTGVVVSP